MYGVKAKFPSFTDYHLAKIEVRLRTILAGYSNDFVRFAGLVIDPNLQPLLDFTAFSVNLSEFLNGNLVERIAFVNVNTQCIQSDHKLGRFHPVFCFVRPISLAFILQLEFVMSTILSMRSAMPTPDPPPATVTTISTPMGSGTL